jgi:hypothetical protein
MKMKITNMMFLRPRRFGFTNMTAVKGGMQGTDCRGEEHVIELVWSVKSGKTKVLWNKNNISHYFREKQEFDKVQFSWESRSRESFQIVAHAKPNSSHPQYDFLIGNTSFFSLPHVSQLRRIDVGGNVASEATGSCGETRMEGSVDHDHHLPQEEETPLDFSFRLSMAGFAPPKIADTHYDLQDELTAELFTNNLESLRQRVTSLVPETEDMVSRAIINAFSEDLDDSQTSSDCSSSCESVYQTTMQIEADAIWETNAWMGSNVEYAPRPDVKDQKRIFVQKQIDKVFMHVRHERLTEDAAGRILTSVATLLSMRLSTPVAKDTLVLKDLGRNVQVENLIDSLCVHGEVKEAAVSRGRCFGVCRFSDEQGLSRALEAAENGSMAINGRTPIVSLLEQPVVRERPDIYSRAKSEPNIALKKPSLSRRRSHQRNTITIDTTMPQGPFLCLVNDTSLVTPEASRTLLRPDFFANIPAGSSPLVFDAKVVSPEAARYSPTSMIVRE